MATIANTPSNTWKAVERKRGSPVTLNTFLTRRDTTDTVRLDLALIWQLFAIAIEEWRPGLVHTACFQRP